MGKLLICRTKSKTRLAIILCSLFLLARIVVSTECITYHLPQFDKPSYKPGESGVFSAIIEAEAGSKMNIYIIQVELFFDWERYTSSEVVTIPFGHTKTINVTFSVPTSVLPGNYSYYYEITYSLREDLGSPQTSTSSPSTITISSEDSFPWEYMIITAILIVIGILASFIVIKSKMQKKNNNKVVIKNYRNRSIVK